MQPLPSDRAPARHLPQRPLPPYRFVPGAGLPHPINDPAGHSYEGGQPPAWPDPWRHEDWASNEDYLYGVDLYNQAYWWEAHEAWEGLWQVTDKVGPPAQFVQGLIQVSAASLKAFMGSVEGASRLSSSGEAKLKAVLRSGQCHEGRFFMGLDLSDFLARVRRHFEPYRAGQAPADARSTLPTIELEEDPG